MLGTIVEALKLILTPATILIIILGGVLGVVVGSLPGLTGIMAIALVLPITLYMSPWLGIALILAIMKTSNWGGTISAILINTPGTPAAAAMANDGYPLTLKGKAKKALEASLKAAWLGDFFSDLVALFVSQPLSLVALMFGPPELVLVMALALLVIASVDERSKMKALIAAGLGLVVSCIGLDPVMAAPRLTFGNQDLLGGISLVPMMIGIFAMSEIMWQFGLLVKKVRDQNKASVTHESSAEGYSWREAWGHKWALLRSSLIGTWIGVLPGIGSAVSPWIAYTTSKRASKHPEEYGEGSVEGLVSCQSAASAVGGSNIIPLLTLGIPGDTSTALMLGALIVHGLQPGPLFFRDNPTGAYAIILTLLLCDAIYYFIGKLAIRGATLLTRIRTAVMLPFIIGLCVVGAWAFATNPFDVYVMLAFGLVGYFMRRTGLSIPSFIIAFILGPMLEANLRRSLLIYESGILQAMLSRPIALILLLGLVVCVVSLFKPKKKRQAAA